VLQTVVLKVPGSFPQPTADCNLLVGCHLGCCLVIGSLLGATEEEKQKGSLVHKKIPVNVMTNSNRQYQWIVIAVAPSVKSVLLYMAELNQSVAKETSLPAYRKICSYGHQTITIINDALKVLSSEN
jgi:hypothetical protein